MKKQLTIILTLALSAACTKSTVTYDHPQEIAISPVTASMTKAAVVGAPAGQELFIYANYENGKAYMDQAVFEGDQSGLIWTGRDEVYFWPKSGEIHLAGSTALKPDGNANVVAYDFDNNTISVADYRQSLDPSETVDFLWFNKTEAVNLDRTTDNLRVTLDHALTWVTIQVKGFGGSEGWKVESIVLKEVKDKGTLTCRTSGAEWKNVGATATGQNLTVYEAPKTGEDPYFTLASQAKDIEDTPKGTVLIPQTPVQMEVKYHTTGTPSDGTLRSKTLDLKISDDPITNVWKAGMHYVYTITFNPYKISFTVNESDWGEENEEINDFVDKEIKDEEIVP